MRRLAALTLGLCVAVTPAAGDPLYDSGRAAWQARSYPIAYEKLIAFRRGPYGRRPDVDFMLGTSGCRIATRQAWGHDVLDWMLYAYALTFESRLKVANERDLCRGAALGATVATEPDEIEEARAAGMTGYGKTFYWAEQEQQPVASYPIHRTRAIPREEFTARLVPIEDGAAARAQAERLSGGGRSVVAGRFVVTSLAGHSASDLEAIAGRLDGYAAFLADTYGVLLPPHFLSVYLVSAPGHARELADRLHGLDVSYATLGYAFVDDQSVVAVVPSRAAGTVYHELFHLLVRGNFGDVPQWLDEGIAALYEVSTVSGGRYLGLDNPWRKRVLDEYRSDRPTIAELIRSEWFLFDDPEQVAESNQGKYLSETYLASRPGREQAVSMATARYFALYLDQRDELYPVYRAFRDRDFTETSGDARDAAVALVEATLGRPIAAIDADFEEWLDSGLTEQLPDARAPVVTGGTLHAANADANVRSGPGTGFERVSSLRRGQKVAVFDSAGEWFELRLRDGTKAYVAGRYLDEVMDKWTPEQQQ